MIHKLIEYILYNNIINEKTNFTQYGKIFGVFVSIERSKFQKLKTYPTDIHGCIGYWSTDYTELDNLTITEKILEVGKSAYYNDSRKDYFMKDAKTDLFTTFKIYYMLLPIISIDNESGELKDSSRTKFNNNDYGLIVQNSQNRATYLPGVFENMSWTDIKQSLIHKAGIDDLLSIHFFAYKTHIIKMTLLEHIKIMINNFFNENYKDFIPYGISNDNLYIDKKQYVRNIASMYDILNLNKIDNKLLQIIIKNTNFYLDIYRKKNKEIEMRQASAFLLLLLNKLSSQNYNFKKYNKYIKIISDNLYVQIDNLEPKFELGEVLMALSLVNRRVEILNRKIDDIKIYIETNNNDIDIDNIFQYNWISKFILAYNDKYAINTGLFELLLNKIMELLNINFETYETNYIAVSFECLSSLMLFSLNQLYKIDYKSVINKIEELVIIIVNRKSNKYHLFKFINGSMRIDITGHIINGFICMEKIYDFNIQLGGYKTYYKNNYINSHNIEYKVIYKRIKQIISSLYM